MATVKSDISMRFVPADSVTIPRSEYNDLIAAKAVNDLILATSGSDGYGSSDIIKGLFKLDKYRSALSASEEHISDLEAETGKLKVEISGMLAKIDSLTAKPAEEVPEESPDAEPHLHYGPPDPRS